MSVVEHMTKRVVTVSMDDTLTRIRGLFEQAGFHHLLVIDDDGKLRGVISDRDVLRAVSPYVDKPSERPQDRATLNRRAHQIMSHRPVTLGPNADISEAVEILLARKFSCVPIVDGRQKPVGILTWRDVLRAATGQ